MQAKSDLRVAGFVFLRGFVIFGAKQQENTGERETRASAPEKILGTKEREDRDSQQQKNMEGEERAAEKYQKRSE